MIRPLARSGAALAVLLTSGWAAAQPGTLDVTGTTVGAPTAALPLFGSTPDACALAPSAEPYEATPFGTDTDGEHAVSVVDPVNDPLYPGTDDTVLLIYEAPFDPADACAGFLGIGNDPAGTPLALTLAAGTDYVLVVAGFYGTEDAYSVRITGPDGSVIAGPAPPLACTITSPLVISAFSTSETTVTNTSASAAVDLDACTVAAYDGYTELVTAAEGPTDVLAPTASLPVALAAPAGPGAVVVAATDLAVGSTVGDAAGSVVAAIVYDATGALYVAPDGTRGECGNGPGLNACNSPAGGAAVARAMAALFGGAVAGESDGAIALDVTVAPNPAAGRSMVGYGLAEAGDARVAVYDALGREVAVLAAGAHRPGRHQAVLAAGSLPAGVYVVRVAAGADVRTTRLTVAR